MTPVSMLAGAVAAGLAVPVSVLGLECLFGVLPPRRQAWRGDGPRPSTVILVPAHDEEAILGATLASLSEHLGPRDRIVVVADNCTDGTADVARALGVDVLERTDAERRGKGFALSFALQALSAAPPDVVVVFDADCRADPGSLEAVARLAASTGRPVQAEYVMAPPPDASPKSRVSAFAVLLRNRIRARGLNRVAGTCQLVGSGMAFPWAVIREARALGGHLVEDLALGLDCARRGHPPLLLAEARVVAALPGADDAALTQRRRWETGHLSMGGEAAAAAWEGCRRGEWRLVALGLDLLVPPLSLLGFGVLAGMAVAGVAMALGAPISAGVLAGEAAFSGSVLALAWAVHGRGVLPPRALLGVPRYVLWKLPVYLRFVRHGKEPTWVRTERGTS